MAPGSRPCSAAALLPYLGRVTPPVPCCKTAVAHLAPYCEGVLINISKALRSSRNGCRRGKHHDQQITGSPAQALHRGAAHLRRQTPGKKYRGAKSLGSSQSNQLRFDTQRGEQGKNQFPSRPRALAPNTMELYPTASSQPLYFPPTEQSSVRHTSSAAS